jgi:hypothetical protein
VGAPNGITQTKEDHEEAGDLNAVRVESASGPSNEAPMS